MRKLLILTLSVTMAILSTAWAQEPPAASATGDQQQVIIGWDANDPAPEGYRVFMRKLPDAFNRAAPVYEGPGLSATITGLEPGATYGFVVIAYDGNLTSADSDQVIWTTGTGSKTIVYPAPVQNPQIQKVTVNVTIE